MTPRDYFHGTVVTNKASNLLDLINFVFKLPWTLSFYQIRGETEKQKAIPLHLTIAGPRRNSWRCCCVQRSTDPRSPGDGRGGGRETEEELQQLPCHGEGIPGETRLEKGR